MSAFFISIFIQLKKFSLLERKEILDYILKMATSDERSSGGALVGSFATGTEDKWSDIDITFGIKRQYDHQKVLENWTAILKKQYDIKHHFDVIVKKSIYRVLLFGNGLELDLSISPEDHFGPKTPTFSLLFGKPGHGLNGDAPNVNSIIGWGWHHILHARAAIHRTKHWQALFFINRLRDLIIELKCYRQHVPHQHARGADQLNEADLSELKKTLVSQLTSDILANHLNKLKVIYLNEINKLDQNLAIELKEVLSDI